MVRRPFGRRLIGAPRDDHGRIESEYTMDIKYTLDRRVASA
jgi:hypothetical protein